jgi:glycosyltransferase involved in cell wall biosynthesis
MPAPSYSVSVIIPVRNGAAFLADAVGSVRAQRYDPLEIVVVDDGSTDDSAAVAAALGARVLRQPNRGPASARNLGIARSSGDLVGFLDADDLWTGCKLALEVPPFRDDPDLEVVQGLTQEARIVRGAEGRASFENFLEPFVSVSLGSALFRRSVFERIGVLDPGLRFAEDLDWFVRARDLGVRMLFVNEVTQIARRHGGNTTWGKKMQEKNFLRILKRSLDRRRRAGLTGPVPRFTDFVRVFDKPADAEGEGAP